MEGDDFALGQAFSFDLSFIDLVSPDLNLEFGWKCDLNLANVIQAGLFQPPLRLYLQTRGNEAELCQTELTPDPLEPPDV